MQLFLPQQGRCPLRYMQQILRDEKLVINRQAVPQLFVPNWPELGVRTIWPQAARIKDFLRHLPDDWRPDHNTERKFFYGVLTSLAPQFVHRVVNEARQLRHAHRQARQQPPR